MAKRGLGEVSKAMVYKLGEENDTSDAASVRELACWVMSTVAQNNPFSQNSVLEQGVLPITLHILEQSKNMKVSQKALGIISGE